MKTCLLLACIFVLQMSCTEKSETLKIQSWPDPQQYIAYTPDTPFIIDGRQGDWSDIPWSSAFADIEGYDKTSPYLETRFKMAWDQDSLYLLFNLEEPHLWATITEPESIIYRENNIEFFIDPDGDTHHYMEAEINVLGTLWDLMLTRPYRDGGSYLTAWDMDGIHYKVQARGTINDPSDRDEGWTLEAAVPWSDLSETIGRRPPEEDDIWRMNFSRVEYDREIIDGEYRKKEPEHNWVWTPTGRIDMHMPERWGYVKFSRQAPSQTTSYDLPVDEEVKRFLRAVYYDQRVRFQDNGRYASSYSIPEQRQVRDLAISLTPSGYTASAVSSISGNRWIIREDGRIWQQNPR